MRIALPAALVLSAAFVVAAAREDGVRVWRGTVTIPTYDEGPPNPNPPFDLFSWGRFNYPYTLRDNLVDRRTPVIWRSLHLENEYLRLIVLPDLGGRIYSCLDKRTSREMFYANPSIKKALIGYRGAWAAFGVEFNFPVSHNWVSMSPVDFATASNPDGSGSIWVANTDLVYGGRWRVELRLQPARTVLEQRVELSNPGEVRHRYYWWSNAAVEAWDDSRLVYPTEVMSTHGFTRLEPWPVAANGRDLSVIAQQTEGPVSLFTYATREGFVGVYHPHTRSGTVHLASPDELPVHKVWSWGADREAHEWRAALSDNDSAYVELQAGLFRNQETYAFLEPQGAVRFVERWLPVGDLGGITRATEGAVLAMTRMAPSEVRLALDVTHDLPDAHLVVRHGSTTALDVRLSLSPRAVWRRSLGDVPPAEKVVFELTDASGATVLTHTEGRFDHTPASRVPLGPTGEPSSAMVGQASAAAILERGTTHELNGRRLDALAGYRAGLAVYPEDPALLEAAGRLALAMGWVESGEASVVRWLTAASADDPIDPERQYYLGAALSAADRADEARPHLEVARRAPNTRAQATVALSRLSARQSDFETALRLAQALVAESPQATAAGALEVSLLRRLGRRDDARARVRTWLGIDPASSLLRYEATLNGEADEELWPHLGADANRVLDIADHYLAAGMYADAVSLLEREYPAVEPPIREPGVAPPGGSPLVAYYRGYARERSGQDGTIDYRRASALSTAYMFPARRSTYRVLESALRACPEDGRARYLLGALYLSSGLTDRAIVAWQQARRSQPPIATLHRSLGLALVRGQRNFADARAVLEEGLGVDPDNPELYLTLDQVLSALDAPPVERVAALRRYPAPASMPAGMAFKLAWALAEAGEEAPAGAVFRDRYFPREEGGLSVRLAYTETRLISASVAARQARCVEALGLLDSLAREQAELAFTAGGLAALLTQPVLSHQAATIEWACGRRPQARSRWERLAGLTSSNPMQVALSAIATRSLGRMPNPADRRRWESALVAAAAALDESDASSPGLTECARGLLLQALGRTSESRQSLRRVFSYPDRNLSHVVARAALHAPVARGAEAAARSR